jgi:hypothetical protein
MGLRFRRTVKLAPGVRLNLSKSGASVSLGARGASVTVGPRGTYANVGIPGTGISYREKLGGGRSAAGRGSGGARSAFDPYDAEFVLDEDGAVHFTDAFGEPLSPAAVRRVREERGDELSEWLSAACAEWNGELERVLHLHRETPAPDARLAFEPRRFDVPPPTPFTPRAPGLLERFWGAAREKLERENEVGAEAHRALEGEWERQRTAHEAAEARRRHDFEMGRRTDREVMERFLAERLECLQWPRETLVAFEIGARLDTVYLDVDLPEIEMLPREEAAVAARGVKLQLKERSETQLRKDYAWHIHAILFRLIGEAFTALPGVRQVVASGYSQRTDPATGQRHDEYLLSARVERAVWARIDFARLEALDLPAAFERFELRRQMTKTGLFTAVEPFGALG